MKQDFVNQRFGRLVITKNRPDLRKPNNYNSIVECLCDCGETKSFLLSSLKSGNTKSCGCFHKEATKERFTLHGLSYIAEHTVWRGIILRCYNKKHAAYSRYGGRGIIVCEEWKDSFETFYKDMGAKPTDEHSIDRRDNDKGYSKENCRWATLKEQNDNRSNVMHYTHNGKTKNITDWCSELGLNFRATYLRIKKGMLFEVAIALDTINKNSILKIGSISKTMYHWCVDNKITLSIFRNRLYKGWTIVEALSDIASRKITFNPCTDGMPPETMSLDEWCGLLELDKDTSFLRILRGESFEVIVNE